MHPCLLQRPLLTGITALLLLVALPSCKQEAKSPKDSSSPASPTLSSDSALVPSLSSSPQTTPDSATSAQADTAGSATPSLNTSVIPVSTTSPSATPSSTLPTPLPPTPLEKQGDDEAGKLIRSKLDSSEETLDQASELISYQQAIKMALNNNFDIEIKRVEPLIESSRVLAAWGNFEPTWTYNGSRVESLTPVNAQTAANGGFPPTPGQFVFDREWDNKFLLDEKLPTGTQIEFEFNTNSVINTYNSPPRLAAFSPEYSSYSGVKVTQPLLKDFGFDAQLSPVRISRTNRKIAEENLLFEMALRVSDVTKAYYDALASKEDVRVKQIGLNLSEALLKEAEDQMERGSKSINDVNVLEIERGKNHEALALAQVNYNAKVAELKNNILSNYDPLNPPHLQLSSQIPEYVPSFSRSDLLQKGLAKRGDYLSAIHAAEREEIKLKFEKNQSLPKLDLVGSFGYNGLDNGWRTGINSSIGQEHYQTWNFGIQTTIPLGNDIGKGKVEEQKHLKEQALIKIKQLEVRIAIDLDSALQSLEIARSRLDSAKRVTRRCQEVFSGEEIRLDKGQSTPLDALSSYRQYAEAQGREAAAAAEVQKAVSTVWFASGLLLEKLDIALDKSTTKQTFSSPINTALPGLGQ